MKLKAHIKKHIFSKGEIVQIEYITRINIFESGSKVTRTGNLKYIKTKLNRYKTLSHEFIEVDIGLPCIISDNSILRVIR